LTKVGCFNGKEKHQLAGAGLIPIDAMWRRKGWGLSAGGAEKTD
jgi:hypothetical protein